MVVVHGRGRAERGWFVSSGRFEPLSYTSTSTIPDALVLGPQMLEAHGTRLRAGRCGPQRPERTGRYSPTPPFFRDANIVST